MTSYPPFRPLRGALPPHFVDRPPLAAVDAKGLVASTLAGLCNSNVDPRWYQAVTGGAAMGKTAFARHLAARATAELGWQSFVHHCARRGANLASLAAELADFLHFPASIASCSACPCRCSHPAGRALRVVLPAPEGAAGTATAQRDWSFLYEALLAAGRHLRRAGKGLLVVVDDADRLVPPDGAALGQLAGALRSADVPVAITITVRSPDTLTTREGEAPQTLWRETLGPMDAEQCAQALVVPAARKGVSFDRGALDAMATFAAGSPLAVQRAGLAVWPAANGRGRVSERAALAALRLRDGEEEVKAS